MKRVWDTDELVNIWGLTYDERQLLKTKPPRNHLGFTIQLKYYQYSGRFIKSHSEIAETSLLYLSEQLEVPVTDIDDYDWDGRSGKRHRTEILSFLGINRLSEPVKESFSKWLVNEIYPQGQTIPEAINLAYNWFKNHQTESLIDAVLNRLARAAVNQHENRLFGKIIRSLLIYNHINPYGIFELDMDLRLPIEYATA